MSALTIQVGKSLAKPVNAEFSPSEVGLVDIITQEHVHWCYQQRIVSEVGVWKDTV